MVFKPQGPAVSPVILEQDWTTYTLATNAKIAANRASTPSLVIAAVDEINQVVYFADKANSTIEAVNLDGTGLKTLKSASADAGTNLSDSFSSQGLYQLVAANSGVANYYRLPVNNIYLVKNGSYFLTINLTVSGSSVTSSPSGRYIVVLLPSATDKSVTLQVYTGTV